MSRQSGTSSKKKATRRQSDILETITAADALAILRRLVERDAQMAKQIEDVAIEIFSDVDIDSVASEVLWELESLNVEDVWDCSGSTRDGYVDPGDAAWRMFEDALLPFQEQAEKYMQLSMNQEAKLVCMGILKGIYDFHKESESEYKDWAVDAPAEYFHAVLHDWQKSTNKRSDLAEMKRFTEKNCPAWTSSRGTKPS
jgi:hypothetical protein